eukprot:scaffold63219_cov33-Tisochrysis_lutea.AAC.10
MVPAVLLRHICGGIPKMSATISHAFVILAQGAIRHCWEHRVGTSTKTLALCNAGAIHDVRTVADGACMLLARLPERLFDVCTRVLVHMHASAAAVIRAESGAAQACR